MSMGTSTAPDEVLITKAARLRGMRLRYLVGSPLRRNTIANIAGRVLNAALAIVFTPLYLRLLGVEAYGLIGFFTTLQVVFGVLDLGLSPTLNRELARLSAWPDRAHEQRDLVRSLEVVYWTIAMFIAAGTLLGAPWLASHWIKADVIQPATIAAAIRVMGFVVALQFPFTLYQGGLLGLQRQLPLNALLALTATLRFAIVVPVLLLFGASLQNFFTWQLVVAAVQTSVCAWLLWGTLPPATRRAHFDANAVQRVRRFAVGMFGISLSAVVLTQSDKIILSKVLSLGAFGLYSLAVVVAGGLYTLISPLFSALFPRFSQLVAAGDEDALIALYHRASEMMALILVPVALVIAIFSREVMFVWTGDAAVAEQTHLIVTLLTLGTGLNGLMNVPYALQLSYGWTTLTFYSNLVAVAVLAPAVYMLANRFGPVGAAWGWFLLNSGYVLVVLTLVHRRLLRGHLRRWYVEDVGRPLLVALAASAALSAVGRPSLGRWGLAAYLGGIMLVVASGTLISTSVGRHALSMLRPSRD
jgi:O-antigen/teichoic acid export membrane protein